MTLFISFTFADFTSISRVLQAFPLTLNFIFEAVKSIHWSQIYYFEMKFFMVFLLLSKWRKTLFFLSLESMKKGPCFFKVKLDWFGKCMEQSQLFQSYLEVNFPFRNLNKFYWSFSRISRTELLKAMLFLIQFGQSLLRFSKASWILPNSCQHPFVLIFFHPHPPSIKNFAHLWAIF